MQLNEEMCNEVATVLKSTNGKLGLAAVKLKLSIPQLKNILNSNEGLSKVATESRSTLEQVFDDITDLQLKMAIAQGKPWAIAHKLNSNKVEHSYIREVNKVISDVRELVPTISKDGAYVEQFDSLAYLILSTSPFTTKAHLCKAFSVSSTTLEQWITSFPSFNESVSKGIAEGEATARDLLLSSAFELQNKINTPLLKTLASNVYNIQDEPQTVIVKDKVTSVDKISEEMSAKEAAKLYAGMLRESE